MTKILGEGNPEHPKHPFFWELPILSLPLLAINFGSFFFSFKKNIFWAGGPPNLGFAQEKGCFLLGFLPLE